MTSLQSLKKRMLKDPVAKKAYDDLELEFSIMGQIIEKQIKLRMLQKGKKKSTKHPLITQFESGEYKQTISFLRKVSKAFDSQLKVKI